MLRIELLYNLGRVINTVPENTVSEREVLNMITTKMNLEGTTRKELAAAIAEITREEAIYRRTPTYSYGIGDITITRDGSLVFPDDSDILERLAERGFIAEAAEDAQEAAESPQEAPAEEIGRLDGFPAKGRLHRGGIGKPAETGRFKGSFDPKGTGSRQA